MKKEFTILILILLLAGVLRFWHLGKAPPSPDWDEASLGYNAYSIMETGRDEYGKLFPLILRSFDDYKPGLYVYLAIPAIKIFGLNTFAVRFPAALLGTLAVLLVYFLVKELFINGLKRGNKLVNSLTRNKLIALTTSFLLAISPWHIQFSRIAFESNIGLFLNILVALCFLKSFKKPWLLTLAAFFAGLNIYVYQAEKIFTPLLVLAMVLIWRKELLKLPWKYLGFAVVIGAISLLPFVYLIFTTPEIFLRAKGTSFAADPTPFLAKTAERILRDYQHHDYLGLILDNRRVTYLITFIRGYLSHFDLNWLFITGDDARHHAPDMGYLYLWELPFFLLGIYSLLFSKLSRKTKWLIFSWFLIAPIPASFSSGAPHGVRTLRFLPMLQIFVSFGLLRAWQIIRKKSIVLKFSVTALAVLLLIFNFSYYLNQYFVQQNYYYSQYWQYGYQEAIEEIKKIESDYQNIVVSNEPHLDQSYIFFLFYLKYDPRAYQKAGGTISGGFAETHQGFSKYTFRPIKWEEEEKIPEILYVGRPNDFPGEAKIVKSINFLDGEPAIKIVEGL